MSALRQPTPPLDAHSVATVPITSRDVLDALRGGYSFVDNEEEREVMSILEKRPDVAAILIEALPHVRDTFGDSTPVMLLSVSDPTDAASKLSARIVTSEPTSAAHAKRDAFYRAFWLGVPGVIDDVLSFGLIWPRTS